MRMERHTNSAGIVPAVFATGLGFAVAVTGGAAWGVACRLGMDGGGVIYWVCNLASPWLVVAFIAGALARHPAAGLIFGAAALAAGMVAYYDPTHSFGGDLIYARATAEFWMLMALASGSVLGWAGATWRSGHPARWLAVSLVSGLLAAESLVALSGHVYLQDNVDRAYFVGSLAAATMLPFVLLRGRGTVAGAYGTAGLIALASYSAGAFALENSLI